MKSQNDIRSRMLAGHLEATTILGEIWKGLSESETSSLINRWRDIMDYSDEIGADIVDSIASSAEFSTAWNNFSEDEQSSRARIFRNIAVNDLTLPDGSLKIQRS